MLLSACEKGDLDTVKQVLSPSDIELKNSQGLTALSIASKAGYNNIVQCLLEAGANINTLNNVIFTQ
jgi:ankyrin repeat protein